MELKPSQSITYSAPWHKPCVNMVDRAFILQTMSSGHTRGLPPSESVTRLYTDGGKMTIRLIKLPPAPLIDGYDLSQLLTHHLLDGAGVALGLDDQRDGGGGSAAAVGLDRGVDRDDADVLRGSRH